MDALCVAFPLGILVTHFTPLSVFLAIGTWVAGGARASACLITAHAAVTSARVDWAIASAVKDGAATAACAVTKFWCAR